MRDARESKHFSKTRLSLKAGQPGSVPCVSKAQVSIQRNIQSVLSLCIIAICFSFLVIIILSGVWNMDMHFPV